jgi:hypothetical protein
LIYGAVLCCVRCWTAAGVSCSTAAFGFKRGCTVAKTKAYSAPQLEKEKHKVVFANRTLMDDIF